MATPAQKRSQAAEARKSVAASEAASVRAEDLKVGDEIFFPNSRKAQRIESIADEKPADGEERYVRRVIAGEAEWSLNSDSEVRKVL